MNDLDTGPGRKRKGPVSRETDQPVTQDARVIYLNRSESQDINRGDSGIPFSEIGSLSPMKQRGIPVTVIIEAFREAYHKGDTSAKDHILQILESILEHRRRSKAACDNSESIKAAVMA